MAYVKSGKPAGRPKTYHSDAEKPRHLSIRLPVALYAQLEHAAAEQHVHITRVVTCALTRYLESPELPDLAGLVAKREAALDMANDAMVSIQGACDPCPQCSKAIDHILAEAWAKLSGPGEEKP